MEGGGVMKEKLSNNELTYLCECIVRQRDQGLNYFTLTCDDIELMIKEIEDYRSRVGKAFDEFLQGSGQKL